MRQDRVRPRADGFTLGAGESVREQTFSLWAHPRGRREGNYMVQSTVCCATVVSNLRVHFSGFCMMDPFSMFLDPTSS